MISVTRKSHFNAAHRLHNTEWSDEKNDKFYGLCNNKNFHGHNYDLYVTIKGPIDNSSGFVVNLKELNEVVNKKVINVLDHNLIQDVEWFKDRQPSTENLVVFVWEQIVSEIVLPAKLFCVKLRETGTIFTEYYGDE